MKYRALGEGGPLLSVVGLGTWQFGGEWGRDYTAGEVEAILERASSLGINFLDTAECYGPDRRSETLIGQALGRNREKWLLATKFGHAYDGHARRKGAWSVAEVLAQLDASLEALRTDYVDLYQFHSGTGDEFFRDDLWAALRERVRQGRIRRLGVSISSQAENLDQVEAAPGFGISAVQLVYNRLDRGPEARVLPACGRLGLGVLARVPLASGFLSGKYRPGAAFAENDVRSGMDRDKARSRLAEAERIAREEVPSGVDLAAWALAWCLRDPRVTAVIPGCKDPSQVERNAAAADLAADPN
jgi:aryl-alcohol dehydrogenase-like predicted oxidoreductase